MWEEVRCWVDCVGGGEVLGGLWGGGEVLGGLCGEGVRCWVDCVGRR